MNDTTFRPKQAFRVVTPSPHFPHAFVVVRVGAMTVLVSNPESEYVVTRTELTAAIASGAVVVER